MKKFFLALTTWFLLSLVFFVPGVLASQGYGEYVPDRGVYAIQREYAYSEFIWNEPGFEGSGEDAYEHEFRVYDEEFAGYNGYWSSNIPQPYPDMEDNKGQGHDEFVVGCDNAEGLLANQNYSIYIDLNDKGGASGVDFTLEAERCTDVPGGGAVNLPELYWPIINSWAPDDGSWGGGIETTSPPGMQGLDLAYVEDTQETSLQNPMQKRSTGLVKAIVTVKSPLSLTDTEQLVKKYQIKPLELRFIDNDKTFCGGFNCNNGEIQNSLQKVIKDLQADISFTKSNRTLPKQTRDKILKWQVKNLQTLETTQFKILGIVIENTLDKIEKLQLDSKVANVEIY